MAVEKQQKYKNSLLTFYFNLIYVNTSWLLSVEFGDLKRDLAIFLATNFPSYA